MILERAKFNRRCQRDGETVDEYITALYTLVETCDYKGLKEEMLRDRLVVGIKDLKMPETLQLDAGLTLESAKKKIRQKEAVHQQGKELQAADKPTGQASLQAVKGRPLSRRGGACGKKEERSHPSSGPQRGDNKPQQQCTRCGGGPHPLHKCYARTAVCNRCSKKGHYSRQCINAGAKPTKQASARELNLDSAFLGTLSPEEQSSWSAEIKIKDQVIPFKLDTGAEVTAISEETYQQLGNIPLEKSTRVIYGPSRTKLEVRGQIVENLSYAGKSSMQTLFVIRNLRTNLLPFHPFRF